MAPRRRVFGQMLRDYRQPRPYRADASFTSWSTRIIELFWTLQEWLELQCKRQSEYETRKSRMAMPTDDTDYDAGETFGNVPRPWSYSGNDDADNGLRTICVPLSLPANMTMLRKQGQTLSNIKEVVGLWTLGIIIRIAEDKMQPTRPR
ncbi:unnamed protein product [Protopolystoma xenopodis]|uniref:Uncharacterized protein n=1 Tax=Protopolystoma xenopodis TaxID=117903 RepID=A0A3S5AP01_9PLAT|nr:unnamed protein product [Protopolystoma xenopodis]